MASVRAMRLLNAICAGTLTGAQLETLLADPTRLEDFRSILMLPGQSRRLWFSGTGMAAVAESSAAMAAVTAAVTASSTAMTAVTESSAAMTAIAASSTAMAAIAALSAAMTAVAASSTAKLALYESDTALTACFNSSTAMAALRDAATIYSKFGSGTTSVSLTLDTSLTNDGKYLLLGVSGFDTSTRTITVSTRRDGSTRPNSISTSGYTSGNSTAGALACCPITGPLSFKGSGSGSQTTYLSLLRCDV